MSLLKVLAFCDQLVKLIISLRSLVFFFPNVLGFPLILFFFHWHGIVQKLDVGFTIKIEVLDTGTGNISKLGDIGLCPWFTLLTVLVLFLKSVSVMLESLLDQEFFLFYLSCLMSVLCFDEVGLFSISRNKYINSSEKTFVFLLQRFFLFIPSLTLHKSQYISLFLLFYLKVLCRSSTCLRNKNL